MRSCWAVTAFVVGACAYDRPQLADLDAAAGSDAITIDAAGGPLDGGNACAADAACASGVCDAGACVASDLVRYVTTTGDDTAPCLRAQPCRTVARAIAARGARAIVVLAAGSYPGSVAVNPPAQTAPPFDVLLIGGTDVDQAPAVITAPEDGSNSDGVEVYRGAVRLRNLQVRGSSANGSSDAIWTEPGTTVTLERVIVGPSRNDGLDCNGCTLVATGSTFSDNGNQGVQVAGGTAVIEASVIARNPGGGLAIDGASCTIASSFIVGNGAAGSAVGGADVTCGRLRIEHNTWSGNVAADAAASIVRCGGSTGDVAVRNNLYGGPGAEVVGCASTYSLFAPGAAVPGAGNVFAPSGLVSATDLHILATSAARGAADPATPTDLGIDIDRQARVQGARDIGADEIP